MKKIFLILLLVIMGVASFFVIRSEIESGYLFCISFSTL